MNTYVILPTHEAFSYFNLAEHYLMFYEDGLRGLLRDHVLVSDPHLCDNDDIETIFGEDPLQQKIVESYRNSYIFKRDEHMGRAEINISAALEISAHVRNWVNAMMRSIYPNEIYHIHEQYYRWFGSDLHVRIDVMDA